MTPSVVKSALKLVLAIVIPVVTAAITAVTLIPAPAAAEISEAGTLRERIPADAIAYLRIPGPWTLLTAMQGRGLENVIDNPVVQDTLDRLRQAIGSELSTLNEEGAVAQLVLAHLRSPIEAVVRLVPGGQKGPPAPAGLVTAKVSFKTLAEVNAMLYTIATASPAVDYISPIQPGSFGLLALDGLPVAIQFEPATQRVSIVAGTAVAQPVVKSFLELPERPIRPIDTLEAEIDMSGRGLLLWINTQALMPFAQLFMPPEDVQIMRQWGLLKARAIAIGMGTTKSKGHARIAVDIPRSGLLELIPTATMVADLDAVGKIQWVAGLGFLETDTIERIEKAIQHTGNTEALDGFRRWRAELAETLDTEIFEELLGSVGPEAIIFSDSAGDFVAGKIRDAQRYRALVAQLAKQPNVTLTRHETDAGTINHLSVMLSEYPPEQDTEQDGPLARWMARADTIHSYWVEDNGYIVSASVPQALIDRINSKYRVSIAQWLAQNEGTAYTNSAALLSLRVDNLPRSIYHYMLQGVQMLSDISGAGIDMMTLPSANQLRLPIEGALGWRLELGAERIAMQMTFDGTPLDVFGSHAMAAVAVAGIAAAVAISAYQDYTLSEHTQEAYSAVLDTVQTHHATYGQLPAAGAKLELPPATARVVAGVEVDVNGDILVELTGDESIAGTVMRLRPQIGTNGIAELKCVGGELRAALKPEDCR